MLVSAFILVVPMLYIFIQAFSKGLIPVLENTANPDMLHASQYDGDDALVTVPVNLVFGTFAGLAGDTFYLSGAPAAADVAGYPVRRLAGGGRSGVSAVLRL